jgi:hypothetical protein
MRTKEKRSSTVRFNSAEISVIERVLRCRRALFRYERAGEIIIGIERQA